MTYGENGRLLRAELTVLLQQHRIQHRLGGQGTHTVPETTTSTEREELGKLIRRYRHGVLLWSLQAVTAANPHIAPEGTTGRSRGPSEELRHRLQVALTYSKAGLPTPEELTTEQPFGMVESWRKAARAAALGEHDFGAGVGLGLLDQRQSMTVLKDAAEVARALVVLDRRYKNIPGWEPLKEAGSLGRAAATCATVAGYDGQDHTVDARGWRPPPAVIDGPALPGVAGVVQAEHNLLLHLRHFPAAINLRRILDSQRALSHHLAVRVAAVAPELSKKWLARAQTYTSLFAEARNLGGLIGDGSHAASEGANAIDRLRKIPAGEQFDRRALADLDRLFNQVDARLVDVVDHGVSRRLYFIKATVPRIDDRDGQQVHGLRERFMPITSPVQTDLVGLVHQQLRPRPQPQPVPPPPAADASRRRLRQAIVHRPGDPAGGPTL